MSPCPDCSSTHLGPPCGMTFAQRLRTVGLHTSATPTRTRARYFDAEPVHAVFGPDARERMLEETDGLGPVKRGPDGSFFHQDRHTGDVERVSDERMERALLGKGTEDG